MSLLVQRGELNPLSRSHRREIEAGGRWVAFGQPDPDELVAEITARGVRSLVTFQRDLSFLREVPWLEFLVVSSDPKDVAPIHDLSHLRNLAFTGTWGGHLDFRAFPKLESFEVIECPRDGGGLDTLFAGHPVLESLAIGRYRHDDLTPLGALRLRRLALSGRLSSLGGAGALTPTLERHSFDLLSTPSREGFCYDKLDCTHIAAVLELHGRSDRGSRCADSGSDELGRHHRIRRGIFRSQRRLCFHGVESQQQEERRSQT